MKAILRTLCGCTKEVEVRGEPPTIVVNYLPKSERDWSLSFGEAVDQAVSDHLNRVVPIKQRFFKRHLRTNKYIEDERGA